MAKGKRKKPKYKAISQKDRDTLSYLLEHGMKLSDEWWQLDAYWIGKYGYSLRVQLIFDFIQILIVPSGKGAGKPLKLRDFQKDFIKDVYGPVIKSGDAWIRLVRRAILSVGRKNGKTLTLACLVLVHLLGPESITNGEIYSAANSREQASKIFKYAAQVVRADQELLSHLKIVDSTKTMVCFANGSVYRAVAAEAGTNYGENPSFVIYDELAQAKNADLYDAFDTSMGARLEPLFAVISTQSKDPLHILSQIIDDAKHDPTTVCHLYEVPTPENDEEDDALTNEKLWYLANPALGDFLSIKEMRIFAQKAVRMPARENAFRNLYLNQRCNAESPFIPRAEWVACLGDYELPKGTKLYMGLDLSGKIDLTALVGVSDEEIGRTKAWFWKPKDALVEHERRDKVPYGQWAKQGIILTTPGRAIQYSFIAYELAEINKHYDIAGIAFDRYRIDDLMVAMDAIGVDAYVDGKDDARDGAIRLVPWGQGYASMTQAVEAVEIAIIDRKFMHDGNPCLTWNFSNAIIMMDASGNRKLNKAATRFRIDGAVACAMAIGLKSRDMDKGPQKSAYDDLDAAAIKARILGTG